MLVGTLERDRRLPPTGGGHIYVGWTQPTVTRILLV